MAKLGNKIVKRRTANSRFEKVCPHLREQGNFWARKCNYVLKYIIASAEVHCPGDCMMCVPSSSTVFEQSAFRLRLTMPALSAQYCISSGWGCVSNVKWHNDRMMDTVRIQLPTAFSSLCVCIVVLAFGTTSSALGRRGRAGSSAGRGPTFPFKRFIWSAAGWVSCTSTGGLLLLRLLARFSKWFRSAAAGAALFCVCGGGAWGGCDGWLAGGLFGLAWTEPNTWI